MKPIRHVESPVFVLTSVRSGSTMLRLMLDTHSQICAPHELHLNRVRVHMETPFAKLAMDMAALDTEELEYMLWDSVLHRELVRSGKPTIVDKTPQHALGWQRLLNGWPDARFVFLLRHPYSIAGSLRAAHPTDEPSVWDANAVEFVDSIAAARRNINGHTLRYEELTADPEAVLTGLCGFLGLEFEPAMLRYGDVSRAPLRPGLGDWRPKVQSGRVQTSAPVPELPDASPELVDAAATWGYA